MWKKFIKILPFIILFSLSLVFKGLFIFYIPGILLLLSENFLKKHALDKLCYVILSSLGYFIFSFWFLKIFPIGLSFLVYFTIIISVLSFIFIVLFKKKFFERMSFDKTFFYIFGLFLFISFLRLIPFFTTLAPSGSDPTMHTYITALIQLADGIPSTLSPILPDANFGSYSAGFHIVSTVFSIFSGLEPYRAVFFIGCISFSLFFLVLCSFLMKKGVKTSIAIFSSIIVSSVTINPQLMAVWGGYPSAFAFVFAVQVFSLLEDFFRKDKIFFTDILLMAFLVGAVFLSHLLIFATMAILSFIFVVLNFAKLWRQKNVIKLKYVLRNFLAVAGLALLILMPYLYGADLFVSAVGKEFTINWVRNLWEQSRLIISGFSSRILDLGLMFIYSLGASIFVLMILPALFIRKIKRADIFYIIIFFLVVISILIVSRFELTDGFYIFYPERVAMFAILPMSLLFAFGIDAFVSKFSKKILSFCLVVIFILISINISLIGFDKFRSHYFLAMSGEISMPEFLFRELFLGNYSIYALGREQNVLTTADLAAFEWIEKNTEKDALFLNSYNDGGLWISAIPLRPVVNAHANPFMIESANEMRIRTDYDYVYVGNKKNVRIDNTPVDTSVYDNDPKYKLVFREENASIYEVLD